MVARPARGVLQVDLVEVVGPLAGEDPGVIQLHLVGDHRGDLARVARGRVCAAERRAVDHRGRDRAAAVAGLLGRGAVGDLVVGVGRRRPGAARAGAAAAVAPLDGGQLHPAVEVLAQVELELPFEDVGVDDVAFVRLARDDVVVPALGLLLPVAGEAEGDALDAGRAGDGAFEDVVVVVLVLAADLGVPVVGRTLGDQVDRAGDGVTTVERRLRAAQHLHPVQEQRRLARLDRGGRVDAVRIDRHRRVGRVHVGRAADAAKADPVQLARVLQPRREVGHVLDGRDADQVALRRREGRDRHRNVLQALLPPLGGDDQLFDFRSGRVLGEGWRAGERGAETRGGRKQQVLEMHSLEIPSRAWERARRREPDDSSESRQYSKILLTSK